MEERRHDIQQDEQNADNPLYDPYRSGGTTGGGTTSGGTTTGGGGGTHKSFRESSPDEVREMVRERVSKGIAAFTGALEGFVQRTKGDHLADKTREAIEGAGETTRQAISSTGEQIDRTRETLKESHIGESARGLTSDVAQTTRDITRNIGSQSREMAHDVSETTRDLKESAGEVMKSVGDTTKDVAEGMRAQGEKMTDKGTASEESTSGVPDLNKTQLGTQRDLRDTER